MLSLIGLPLPAAYAAGQNPFLPPHATVVLLSGLSGDLQTETSYQEQLEAWLELLENLPFPPHQVFAFSDSPESLTLPPKLSARKFKATREEFLGLGKTLAGQTNPVIVLAWGHGGMQSSTPVFHVSGPRLTAADFKNFAAQTAPAESSWVLYFRGSGKFAAELTAEHRRLLTSEKETSFNSDPMGLPLLLKSLRANPGSSFEALGAELGRVTDAWYKERNLVRTEEPTLWAGLAAPQLLSPPETNSPSGEAQAGDTPPTAPGSSASAPVVSTNLSAAWNGLTRVEPRNYPDADGVVLRRRISYTLSGGSPAIASENEEFIQILTAGGKHLGDFDFSYSPPDEDMVFQNCEIQQPDGKLLSLNPDEIREAAGESLGEYRAAHRKIFSLPGVVPGAVLHIHYQTTWKTFPLPYISLQIPVAAELPVLDASIQVSVPKEAAFHFAFDQISAGDPAIKQTAYGSTYAWQFQNLSANEREPLSPPFREPSLLISTFPDWETFASWYGRISQLSDAVTPEIAARASQLTSEAKTDRERAAMLFNYVTELRYVAVPLGVNSFRPHAADEVLKHQYGDCKDKANLFNAMLHSLKIDAHLVLVPRFTQAHDALPGFAFNHAISQVKLGEETIWVDTTDDVCRFGMLPPGDPGRRVLVMDGKSKTLTQLPLPTPRAHQLNLHVRIHCAEETDALPADLDATASGFPDYELRAASQDNQSTRSLLAVHFRPAAGVFGLEKQSHTSASDLSENFNLAAHGFFAGIISATGDKRALRAPFWLPREWDTALNHRTHPLFLHQGYPLLLDEEFEFSLPAGASQIMLPATGENSAGPLTWKIEWSQPGSGKVSARLHLELARGELSAAETPALQKQLRALFAAVGTEANFTLSP